MKYKVPSIIALAALALPASAAVAPAAAPDGKVSICHRTGSVKNPFVVISVSVNAVQTHLDQHGDVFYSLGRCDFGGGGS